MPPKTSRLLAPLALCAALALPARAVPDPPPTWDRTIHVNGRATGPGDGSAARPFRAVADAFRVAADGDHLSGGKSTRILIAPGVYRESAGVISSGMKGGGDESNANLALQDAPLLLDRDGAAGQVVLSGADDWSWGRGEGGEWTEVADAHVPGARVYSRAWTRRWGMWAGDLGSADVAQIAGQRREMVFVDRHDGRGPQPLAPTVLEGYDFSKVADDGSPATWVGAGQWQFKGFRGLGILKPGAFGVCELGDTPADGAATPDGDINARQDGVVISRNPQAGGKATVKLTFRQVYALRPYPARYTHRIYLCLPAGTDIRRAGVYVSTRAEAFAIEGKKNLTLRHLTVRDYANPNFSDGAARIGRDVWNWRLTTGGVRVEDCAFDDNNARALDLSGATDFVVQDCRFDHNGGRGVSLTYTSDGLLRGCAVTRTGWRTETLGGGSSFAEAGVKTWRSDRLSFVGCRFEQNADKGFYSDSTLRRGRFDDCAFRDNFYGAMHEIPGGPISYTGCRFEGNRVGLSLIEAPDVSVDHCVFLNNSLAAITANTKLRKDNPGGDTQVYSGDKNFGDSMTDGALVAETTTGFSLTDSTLASWVPGARLLRQSDAFSILPNWVANMIHGARYGGNRYYLARSPYAFEGERWFDDFPAWAAATGDTSSTWGPPPGAAPPLPPAPPAYPPGYRWARAATWDAGWLPALQGRALRDDRGGLAWTLLTTRGEWQGPDDKTPWYARSLDEADWVDYRNWDAQHYKLGVDSPTFTKAGVSWMSWDWPDAHYIAGIPVIAWDNPTGRAVAVAVTGTVGLSWSGKAAQPMDVVVALSRAGGATRPLLTRAVEHPAGGGPASLPLSGLGRVPVGPGDRLLITARIRQNGYDVNTAMQDAVTVRLLAPSR